MQETPEQPVINNDGASLPLMSKRKKPMREVLLNSNDRALKYHYLEWVLAHPRFTFMMMVLIVLSFSHNQVLAAGLFILFSAEIILRLLLFMRKRRLYPHKTSTGQQIEILLLCIDTVAVLSLLITVFNIQVDAENIALARLMRGIYLLRSIRFVRYFDLHSAMFSPTYGMLISLIIMVSFFATGELLIGIIIFFFVELSLRLIVMRSMTFESTRAKKIEWMFWWLDFIATTFMMPFITGFAYSSALRMLRMVRLLRPWMVIIRNLREVLREGQYMQEINLIILFLAILSIGGGVLSHLIFPDFDYSLGTYKEPITNDMLAAIWFAFRLLTDPGNSVIYPESMMLALFSICAVILGVFIFAFFIGIGANIVSGLMRRLRNEDLFVKNHMAILGWTPASPYILEQLSIISDRTFSRLKVVLLHHEEHPPAELVNANWVTYRQGEIDNSQDLKRINMPEAKQALLVLPQERSEAVSLSHSFYNMVALRTQNPDIKLSIAIPGMDYPRLNTHEHMLQVGWDDRGQYDRATVIIPEADFRATAVCNILRYSDFDQVLQRLMIPELMDESSIQLVTWDAKIKQDDKSIWHLATPDGHASADILSIQASMFKRGVILLGIIVEGGKIVTTYGLEEQYLEVLDVEALIGIAVSNSALFDEAIHGIHETKEPKLNIPETITPIADLDMLGLALSEPEDKMSLLVVGWIGSLPLLLKRLLRFYHELDLIIVDNLTQEQVKREHSYLQRRLGEEPGLEELVNIQIESWDFNDMERLREHVTKSNHIIISRASSMENDAYAMISMVLSHIATISKDEDVQPQVFPVLENREQASLLQNELSRFNLPTEVHVTVPNEFYGVFVAHTTFHMYAAEDEKDYQIKRAFRHTLDKLMSDSGEDSDMGLKIFKVTEPLPDDPMHLFHSMREAGYIWIGYTMDKPYKLCAQQDVFGKAVDTLFPRPHVFSCKRQNHIVINPHGNVHSQQAWQNHKASIIEIISIGGDEDIELF